MSQQNDHKPHYVQKVSVPLEVLYAGDNKVDLELKASLIGRYKAAYRGGGLTPILLQTGLTVVLTWLRSQKVNWLLSLAMFAFLVHANIPPPPTKTTYSTAVKKGWKSGTKLRYNSDEADVTFIVQEGSHETFSRVGDDLHTSLEVTGKQLRKGCTITINPLCNSEDPIQLTLRPGEVENGETITIKSRGWPKGGEHGESGDLQVLIRRRAKGRRKRQKVDIP
jgi:hypothetical protein